MRKYFFYPLHIHKYIYHDTCPNTQILVRAEFIGLIRHADTRITIRG